MTRQVCNHRSTKRPAKAANLALDLYFLHEKLKDGFGVVLGVVRIRLTLRPSIVSVVPEQHI